MTTDLDWRARRSQRRARLWLGLVSAVMLVAATAAFLVPMLITP